MFLIIYPMNSRTEIHTKERNTDMAVEAAILYKLMTLYMLNKVDFSLTNATIMDFLPIMVIPIILRYLL